MRDTDIVQGPGTTASLWAVAKATVGVIGAPVALPALSAAALSTARRSVDRIEAFPEHLRAVTEGRPSPLPAPVTRRLDAGRRYLITSDLHRCIPGRLDWPRRQRTKELYERVLVEHAERGWDLIENGDVEDFWMVGGSTDGAVYDLAYLGGAAAGPVGAGARRRVLRDHLDRIVENNQRIYDVLRDGFCASGRYHRSIGNHDDAYGDPALVSHLRTHLPGATVADTLVLADDEVHAVVAHGHLTDSWNGPGYAALGRVLTWLLTSIDDLPGLPKREGLPDEEGLGRLLAGRGRNRLITVDPRYGGNRRFDSLDEARLFARLDAEQPEGGWPWLVFGHTHFPMLRPVHSDGTSVRYANSGCGVLGGAISALEWVPEDLEDPLRLVLWTDEPDGPRRVELVPDGPTLRVVD